MCIHDEGIQSAFGLLALFKQPHPWNLSLRANEGVGIFAPRLLGKLAFVRGGNKDFSSKSYSKQLLRAFHLEFSRTDASEGSLEFGSRKKKKKLSAYSKLLSLSSVSSASL